MNTSFSFLFTNIGFLLFICFANDLLSKITKESDMPFAYGGGLNNIEVVKKIARLGVEKISLNTALYKNNNFIEECVQYLGSQSVMASIDLKKTLFNLLKQ